MTNVLERVHDAARHESGTAGTHFMPFAIHQKRDPAFDNVKNFIFI